MEILQSNKLYLRIDGRERAHRPAGKELPKRAVEPLEAICCLACGGVVTSKDQKIQVSGSHSHTFFNPAGIVYEVGCFQRAPGCLVVGEPSAEFTWFPGHLWRLGMCRRCRTHLGWLFAMAENGFYGLILSRLRE